MGSLSAVVLEMSYFYINLALSDEKRQLPMIAVFRCFIMGFNGKCTYYHPPLCKVFCLAMEVASTVKLM